MKVLAAEESLAVERITPHTGVHRLSRGFLESTQDVIALVLVLFALMARTLVRLGREVMASDLDVRNVISEVLFLLLMIELVRLLAIYLSEHHVAVDFMVEAGIVSTPREVIPYGVGEPRWEQIVALALFLLALGLLLQFGDLRPRVDRTTDDRRRMKWRSNPCAIGGRVIATP